MAEISENSVSACESDLKVDESIVFDDSGISVSNINVTQEGEILTEINKDSAESKISEKSKDIDIKNMFEMMMKKMEKNEASMKELMKAENDKVMKKMDKNETSMNEMKVDNKTMSDKNEMRSEKLEKNINDNMNSNMNSLRNELKDELLKINIKLDKKFAEINNRCDSQNDLLTEMCQLDNEKTNVINDEYSQEDEIIIDEETNVEFNETKILIDVTSNENVVNFEVNENNMNNEHSNVVRKIEYIDNKDVISSKNDVIENEDIKSRNNDDILNNDVVIKNKVSNNTVKITEIDVKCEILIKTSGEENQNQEFNNPGTYEENKPRGDKITVMVRLIKYLWTFRRRDREKVMSEASYIKEHKDCVLYSQRDAITWRGKVIRLLWDLENFF